MFIFKSLNSCDLVFIHIITALNNKVVIGKYAKIFFPHLSTKIFFPSNKKSYKQEKVTYFKEVGYEGGNCGHVETLGKNAIGFWG